MRRLKLLLILFALIIVSCRKEVKSVKKTIQKSELKKKFFSYDSYLTSESLKKLESYEYLESKKWDKQDVNLILMGYSQGVSIVTRWASSRKIHCTHLLLHSGAIPLELTPQNFDYLSSTCTVTYLYGNKDEYINEARITEQQLKGTSLFGDRLQVKVFEGIHEVYKPFFEELSLTLNR